MKQLIKTMKKKIRHKNKINNMEYKTKVFIKSKAQNKKNTIKRLTKIRRMAQKFHPLVNEHTGERRVLGSCVSKNKPGVCKSGFPLFDAFAIAVLLAGSLHVYNTSTFPTKQ